MSETPSTLKTADPTAYLAAAREIQPRLVDLRRRIHREPELGLHLPATRAKILEELEDLGLEIKLHQKTSGIVATLVGEAVAPYGKAAAPPAPRRVLLRGDMDALPMSEKTGLDFRSQTEGRMHACGHDAHVAMLAGSARLLSARRHEFAGEVVFMFQPGEEAFGGAEIMLAEGMPRPDGCFAMHVAPQIPTGMVGTKPGAIMASFDDFEIEVRGRGGHASMPHDCIDPIPIACEIVSALQSFVTRQIPATDPGVLTVSQFHGGTTNNVIADTVQLTGTMRALSDKTRALMIEGLPRIAEGIARAHNAEAKVDITGGYPVVVNDASFEAFARKVVSELLGERAVLSLPTPVMGAEDFAYVLNQSPGAMVLLGVRPPGTKNPAPCHSSQMRLDEEAMVLGTALHTAIAINFLAP
jgi:hippurate hydrolase